VWDTIRVSQTQGEGEVLEFVVGVDQEMLRELGRTEEWSSEEEEGWRRKREEFRIEVARKLSGNTGGGGGEREEMMRRWKLINPPGVSFNQIPLVPLQLGRFIEEKEKQFKLRYLYAKETKEVLEKRLKDRFKSSGIMIVDYQEDASASQEDIVRVGQGEGVLEVEIEFVSGTAIESYGRFEEWNEREQREVLGKVEEMRDKMKEKEKEKEKIGKGRQRQPDGTYIEQIPLPVGLRGTEMEQIKGQTLLRVEEVKKKSLEGKVVLGSS